MELANRTRGSNLLKDEPISKLSEPILKNSTTIKDSSAVKTKEPPASVKKTVKKSKTEVIGEETST